MFQFLASILFINSIFPFVLSILFINLFISSIFQFYISFFIILVLFYVVTYWQQGHYHQSLWKLIASWCNKMIKIGSNLMVTTLPETHKGMMLFNKNANHIFNHFWWSLDLDCQSNGIMPDVLSLFQCVSIEGNETGSFVYLMPLGIKRATVHLRLSYWLQQIQFGANWDIERFMYLNKMVRGMDLVGNTNVMKSGDGQQ